MGLGQGQTSVWGPLIPPPSLFVSLFSTWPDHLDTLHWRQTPHRLALLFLFGTPAHAVVGWLGQRTTVKLTIPGSSNRRRTRVPVPRPQGRKHAQGNQAPQSHLGPSINRHFVRVPCAASPAQPVPGAS